MTIPPIAIVLWFRTTLNKVIYAGIAAYALKCKRNVRLQCVDGSSSFLLEATDERLGKRLE